MRDFVKGNFGLIALIFIFLVMFAASLWCSRIPTPGSGDFVSWCESKGGEVLAAIMTAIVGAKNTNQRASDNNGSNGNGTTSGSKTITSTTTSTTGATTHP